MTEPISVEHVEGNIFAAHQPALPLSIEQIQKNLYRLANAGILTFGDINTQLLALEMIEEGHDIEMNYLCQPDDVSLGLQMPDTWYLNRGVSLLSIPAYYNFLGWKRMVKRGSLFMKNATAFNYYGRISLIEVYEQNDVLQMIDNLCIQFFSTSATLTECMRILEGYCLIEFPRLRNYVAEAQAIKFWCESHFSHYVEDAWKFTRKRNKEIFQSEGTTNVREGIQMYWREYLLQNAGEILPGSVELDVLSPQFSESRTPAVILVGEDIFSQEETSQVITFKRAPDGRKSFYHNCTSDDRNLRTARLVAKRFPKAKVILMRSLRSFPNITLCQLSEFKFGFWNEIGFISQILRQELITKEVIECF